VVVEMLPRAKQLDFIDAALEDAVQQRDGHPLTDKKIGGKNSSHDGQLVAGEPRRVVSLILAKYRRTPDRVERRPYRGQSRG
jgi:hypothetical protein